MSHQVYMVRCRDGTLYTGCTTDLERRLAQHNGERPGGARYTRGRGPVELVYREELETMAKALKREAEIKRLSRQRKEGLAAAGAEGSASESGTGEAAPATAIAALGPAATGTGVTARTGAATGTVAAIGRLLVCATPIGNLGDITLRVLDALREADLIAAEDTRQTRKLLSHFDIHTPLTSYHEHNRRGKGQVVLEQLLQGKRVALVSDAGLPGVSDPGEDLVREALAAGVPVEVLPGASAALTALVASGLPTSRFAFEGFLPRGSRERRERLAELAGDSRTLLLYEAPHRLAKTLSDLLKALGDRPAAAARELTKRYEEIRRGSLAELLEHYQSNEPRGEFTLVIGGTADAASVPGAQEDNASPPSGGDLAARVRALEAEGVDRKEAMRQVARETGVSRRQIYQGLLKEAGE